MSFDDCNSLMFHTWYTCRTAVIEMASGMWYLSFESFSKCLRNVFISLMQNIWRIFTLPLSFWKSKHDTVYHDRCNETISGTNGYQEFAVQSCMQIIWQWERFCWALHGLACYIGLDFLLSPKHLLLFPFLLFGDLSLIFY